MLFIVNTYHEYVSLLVKWLWLLLHKYLALGHETFGEGGGDGELVSPSDFSSLASSRISSALL